MSPRKMNKGLAWGGVVMGQVGIVIAVVLGAVGLVTVAFTILMGIAFQSFGSNK
jgi:hypothetical protein